MNFPGRFVRAAGYAAAAGAFLLFPLLCRGQHLYTSPGSAAMGSASLPWLRNPGSMFLNPAMLSFGHSFSAHFSCSRPFSVKDLTCSNLAIVNSSRFCTLGFGVSGLFHRLYTDCVLAAAAAPSLGRHAGMGVTVIHRRQSVAGCTPCAVTEANAGLYIMPQASIIMWARAEGLALNTDSPESGPRAAGVLFHSAGKAGMGIEVLHEEPFPLMYRFWAVCRPVQNVTFLLGMTENPQQTAAGIQVQTGHIIVEYTIKIHHTLHPTHMIGFSYKMPAEQSNEKQ